MKNLSQYKIVFLILAILSLGFISHIIETYHEQKNEILQWSVSTNTNIERLYTHVFENAEDTLDNRIESMMSLNNHKEKIEALSKRDSQLIRQYFNQDYLQLKQQIAGFDIMEIISHDGFSLYRFHNPGEYGDNLSTSRPVIAKLLKAPHKTAFFELGRHGLHFRYIYPVFDEGILLGFIEMGIQPKKLISKTAEILELKNYILKKVSINKPSINESSFAICRLCSDDFIEELAPKFNFSVNNEIIEYQNHHYLIISKPLLDGTKNIIGKSVFIQNVDFLYTKLYQSIIGTIINFLFAGIVIFFLLNTLINKLLKRTREIQLLLDNTNDAVYLVRLEDNQIIDANLRASVMLQYSIPQLQNMKMTELSHPFPNMTLTLKEEINELRFKHLMTCRSIHMRKDGTTFPVESALSYIIINNEEHMIAVARDITEQLKMEQAIEERNKELEHIEEILSKSALYTTSDLEGNITFISDALLKVSGYKREEVIGKNHSIFKHKDNKNEMYENMWKSIGINNESWEGEMKNLKKNGEAYWVHLVIKPMFDAKGEKIGYYSYRENITDKKNMQYLSEHDPLTKAYNRRKGDKILISLHEEVKRYNIDVSLALFDIDHFKRINDAFGHMNGDIVLQSLTKLVSTRLRKTDSLIRWGGEEFLIILPHTPNKQAKILIEELRESIASHMFGKVGKVTCSFGISMLQATHSIESSVNEADNNLYISKKEGRNSVT